MAQKSSGSSNEIEVKLHVEDAAEMLRRLKRLGAKPEAPRTHEMNTLFDRPDGKLASRAQMLRIRVERPARGTGTHRPSGKTPAEVTLTYKGPAAKGTTRKGYKVREEHEVRLGEAEGLERIFTALRLRPWFRYEKFRRAFRLPGLGGLKIDFDETPVGDYLELEGKHAQIDRAARQLGYTPRDYIVKSYGALQMELMQGKKKKAGAAAGNRRGTSAAGSGARGSAHNEPTPHSNVRDMLFHPLK